MKEFKGNRNGTNKKPDGSPKVFQTPAMLPVDGNGRPFHKGARKLRARLKAYEKDSAAGLHKGIPPTKPGSMQY